MTQLITLLLCIHFAIALQCYKYAQLKGYPVKTFTVLGLVPYFNVVVWVYLLFLPPLNNYHNQHKQPL